jgi:hypothetical protein
VDPDSDPGGQKTCGSGFGYGTLVKMMEVNELFVLFSNRYILVLTTMLSKCSDTDVIFWKKK